MCKTPNGLMLVQESMDPGIEARAGPERLPHLVEEEGRARKSQRRVVRDFLEERLSLQSG
jgi:hypothetical protein